MSELISWVVAHWSDLVVGGLAIIGGLNAILKVVAKLTKSTADDELVVWLDKIYSWLGTIAVHPPAKKTK